MAWQGIPFLFDNNNSANDLIIALRSLPKIVVDSPPDYTNLVITALVSLVAGIIPASIAVWTFKRNTENGKAERESQQEFLREEREKQQESLKQDRETQIIIAERNFNMQVLSGNRQSWINNLRDLIAEYSVESSGLISSTNQYRIHLSYVDFFNKHIDDKSDYSRSEDFKDKYSIELERLEFYRDKMNSRSDRVILLSSKVLMMLNPKEIEYEKIKSIFDSIKSIDADIFMSKDGNDTFKRLYAEYVNLNNSLLEFTQKILKSEWERVKAGI